MVCGLWCRQCPLRTVAQGTWSDQCQKWPTHDVLHHRWHLVLGNALRVWSDAVKQELGNLSWYVNLSLLFSHPNSLLSTSQWQRWCQVWHDFTPCYVWYGLRGLIHLDSFVDSGTVYIVYFLTHLFTSPRGAGVPPFRLCSSLVHSLPHLLLFITFSLFFLIHFIYFLLLSIRSLSTRIVPLRF